MNLEAKERLKIMKAAESMAIAYGKAARLEDKKKIDRSNATVARKMRERAKARFRAVLGLA